MRGADLSNFSDNDETKWKGATCNSTTKFSGTRLESEASRKKEGMIDEVRRIGIEILRSGVYNAHY